MTDQTETPAGTLAAATRQVDLPLTGPILLTTLHGPDAARALLRLANGEIRPVEIGTQVDGVTVAAIGEGVVILNDGGQARRIELPGS